MIRRNPTLLERPNLFALLMLVVSLAVGGVLVGLSQRKHLDYAVAQATAVVDNRSFALQRSIDRVLAASYALEALVLQGNGDITDLATAASRLLPQYPGASALGLAPNGVVSKVYPAVVNAAVVGHDVFSDPERATEARLARDTGRLTVAGPFALRQGGEGIVGRLPIYLKRDGETDAAFWGFTFVVLDLRATLHAGRMWRLGEQGYDYELWRRHPDTGKRQIITQSSKRPLAAPVEKKVELPNGSWTLSIAPKEGWRNQRVILTETSIAIIISVLLAVVAKLIAKGRLRERGLESLVEERTAALRAKEEDLQRAQVVAGIGSWIVILGPDGTPQGAFDWSIETFRVLGSSSPLSAEEFIARVHPDQRTRFNELWATALRTGTFEAEILFRVRDEYRWLRSRAAIEHNTDGPRRAVGTVQDINERKLAELRLRDSEERLSAALTGSDAGLWEAELGTGSFFLSQHGNEMLGYGAAGTAPQIPTWRELVHPDDRERTEVALNAYLEGNAPRFDVEQRLRRADGSWLWVHTRGKTVKRDAAGRPLKMTGTHTDITARRAAEDLLRERERQLRRVVANAPIPIMIHAEDGEVIMLSEAWTELSGYSLRDIPTVREWAEKAYGENKAAAVEAIRELYARTAKLKAGEYPIRTRTGETRVWDFISGPLGSLPDGRRLAISTATDVSERRAAELALRDSEARYRGLIDQAPVPIFVNRNNHLELANRACVELFGAKDAAELIGKSPFDLFHSDFHDIIRERLDFMLGQGQPAPLIEEKLVRCDGNLIDVEVAAAPFSDKHGKAIHVVLRDITQRKQSEARLRLQSTALEAAANTIVITDRAGRIEWANTAFSLSSGFSREEAAGRRLNELVKSGRHTQEFYRELWDTILAGRVWHGEIINRRKDRSFYTEEVTITPLVEAGGTITHFIAVKQDITRRKELEEQFRQAQKMEAVGLLAGGVAHDFNNILSAVLLHVGLLLSDRSIDPSLRGVLQELETEIQRGATLTRQLLTFSRKQAIETKLLDLNAVLQGLSNMLRRLLGEHIHITVKAAPNLPLVRADTGMLEQVVINLSLNARDAMPHGGQLGMETDTVECTAADVAAHRDAPPGKYVRLRVSDTGHGMDEQTLQRIFEPFFTTKDAGKGTGLGLATVYSIAQQHQGWVEVASTVGKGSTFVVYLPAIQSTLQSPEPSIPAPAQRGAGETVLVVEDEFVVRDLLCRTLETHGYQVIEASNGPEAVERYKPGVSLLVTDMIMPGSLTGLELYDRLHERQPDLRAILCTGYSPNLTSDESSKRPHFEILRKPFTLVHFLELVHRALRQPPHTR